ncbi:hypothetical protein JY651_28820 [Pyxidicoccus parkwayensis]|uniref:Uncharacterized protein n=1 Tax=Pyxidicoccus parkwayensis TaxID=2813578 RepID=A0ABX7NKF3_9BACT|nr:hypothetical protein [Pyxidicoccus parkwaysis]QSQ19335.1 hypothetical protein JY651_28820 [Pyxidicoccus parkwaysis]
MAEYDTETIRLLIWIASFALLVLTALYFFIGRYYKPSNAYDISNLLMGICASLIPVPLLYLLTIFFSATIGSAPDPVDADYRSCISYARKKGRPYVIQSATMLVRVSNKDESTRLASYRITYALRALRTIHDNEDTFWEEYTPQAPHAKATAWSGPLDEQRSEESWDTFNSYSVRFKANEGEIKTVTTGIEQEYALPSGTRTAGNGKVQLQAGEDYFGYFNKDGVEADAICDLTMVIESSTLPISPATPELVEVGRDNDSSQVTSLSEKTGATPGSQYRLASGSVSRTRGGYRTISGRWKNVFGGQRVGLIYKLEPSQDNAKNTVGY